MPTTTTFAASKEILAYAGQQNPMAIPVSFAQGKQLARGTVLGRVTSTGLYDAYNSGGSGGLGVATGILKDNIDTTAAGVNMEFSAAMYIEGCFTKNNLTGWDSTGLIAR